VTSAVAQGYLLRIQREAVDQPTEERWLRVARWQQWSRNGRMAVDSAERALAINPKSIAAHDFWRDTSLPIRRVPLPRST
jgi:hypothetical protein